MARHKTVPKQQLLVIHAFQRELQGDVIFDYEREQHRGPRYLLRNIKRARHYHEKRLANIKAAQRNVETVKGSNNTCIVQELRHLHSSLGASTHRSSSDSQKPTVEKGDDFPVFAEYIKDEAVKLYISPFVLRRQLSIGQATLLLNLTDLRAWRSARIAVAHDLENYPCRCKISVSLMDQNVNGLHNIAEQTRGCDLVINPISLEVKVNLQEPFNFVVDLSLDSRYHLEIRFYSARKDKLKWPPVPVTTRVADTSLLLMKDPKHEVFPNGLFATCTDLPLRRKAYKRARVMYAHGGTSFKTRHSLGIQMDWKPVPSKPLAQTSQKPTYMKRTTHHLELPRSTARKIANTSQRTAEAIHIITSYTLASTQDRKIASEWREVKFEGFHCPFCLREQSEYDSIVALRFHLLTAHHTHKFVLQEPKSSNHRRATITYSFKVSTADRTSENQGFRRPLTWIAPSTPFDVSAYVDGDESWLGTKKTPVRVKELASNVEDPIVALRRKYAGFLPPQYVQELPVRQKRKYPVVPTKTRDKLPVFTSVTHRILQTDEELSESDDEVDETWLRDKHAQQIMDATHLPLQERIFQIRWNDHVRSEGIPQTFYLSDVFVRWVRKDREWLKESKERLRLYHQFERGLRDRGKISDGVARGCWAILYMKTPAEKERENVANANEVNGSWETIDSQS